MLFLDSVTMKETPDGRDAYPFSVPALRHLERLEFKTPITFFAGNNGSGKSTLLEGLAAGMTSPNAVMENIASSDASSTVR